MGTDTLILTKGMSQFIRLGPSTSVFVRRGAIRLQAPPKWIAEQCWHPEVRVDAEGHYLAGVPGLHRITAIESTEVELLE